MPKLGKLSETELRIMETVWQLTPPITVSQLLEIFSEETHWKTSTISTLLTRLIEKGYLEKRLSGKSNLYYPLISKEDFQKHETQSFLHNIHGGSIKSFFAALADNPGLNKDEISELRQWFSDKGKEL